MCLTTTTYCHNFFHCLTKYTRWRRWEPANIEKVLLAHVAFLSLLQSSNVDRRFVNLFLCVLSKLWFWWMRISRNLFREKLFVIEQSNGGELVTFLRDFFKDFEFLFSFVFRNFTFRFARNFFHNLVTYVTLTFNFATLSLS